MTFKDIVIKRQSVRKYLSTPIDRDIIIKCIESARLAPSASNSQPWHFVIVDEPDLKNKIAEATVTKGIPINKFAFQAPVIVAIVVEMPKTITKIASWIKKRDFPWIDIGIAAEHFCLQATELGLGTCMIGWFDEKKVKKLLNIPSNKRVGLLITLGYPPHDYLLREKIRKPVEKMVSFNQYKK
ncbi:MAG: nitroreductase family protein [Bacteroidales bacterium]|nr:nitroreductase family protein [Bacteroidales bacterium]